MLSQKLNIIQTSNKGQNYSSQTPSCSDAQTLFKLRKIAVTIRHCSACVLFTAAKQTVWGVKDIVADPTFQEHFTSILTLGPRHTTVKKKKSRNSQTLKIT